MQIVPKGVSSTRVELWIGSFRDPGAADLYWLGYRESGSTNWTPVALPTKFQRALGASKDVWHAGVALTGLKQNTAYDVAVWKQTSGSPYRAAEGAFETLPASLPPASSSTLASKRPFTMFLGSCFCYSRDDRQDVGAAYDKLYASEEHRPHLKLLVGDQVYLDDPIQDWVLPPLPPLPHLPVPKALRKAILAKWAAKLRRAFL
jgi:hypothetical protein